MDAASLAGVDEATASLLFSAGLRSVADVARAAETPPGLDAERFAAIREAAQARVVEALQAAGATDEVALASADAATLAEQSGLSVEDVQWFQAAAREALAPLPPPAPEVRVILVAGASECRVELGGVAVSARLVTARASEDAASVLSSAPGDVVLLVEGDAAARARLGGEFREGIPIFRDDGAGQLTRVRVAGIRTRVVVERKPSLWDRLRRKK